MASVFIRASQLEAISGSEIVYGALEMMEMSYSGNGRSQGSNTLFEYCQIDVAFVYDEA
jgi:hypothetical protein